MPYVMRQKLWAWGDDFTIKDEQGNDHFFVVPSETHARVNCLIVC